MIQIDETKKGKFIPLEKWRERVVNPIELKRTMSPRYYQYYLEKYLVALNATNVHRICEIGVRYGYSAFSLLYAHPGASEYVGYDSMSGEFGGVKDQRILVYVRKLLRTNFPSTKLSLAKQDTLQLDNLYGAFDLIHIDGGREERNIVHDLEISLTACNAGGLVIFLDISFCEALVSSFIADHKNEIDEHLKFDGIFGYVSHIIRKK